MGRSPCCAKEGLNRGAWTAMEDKILTDYIKLHGEGSWRTLPKRAGLKRCGKSCRLRWLNYLRPDIKRGNITPDEEELIIRLHRLLGNRWSLIAGRLPGRTDNEIKNYWNSNLSRRLQDHHHQRRNQSNFSNNFSTKNKNTKQSDKNRDRTPSTTNSNPTLHPQNPDPNLVVRTKAVRCTKVFISPPPPPLRPPPPPHAAGGTENNLGLAEGFPEDPFDLQIADFGGVIGELGFAELLGSEQLPEIWCANSNDGDQISPASPSLEEPIVFSQEMMEDWRRSACDLDASVVEFWLQE